MTRTSSPRRAGRCASDAMPAAYAIAHLRNPQINDEVIEYLERSGHARPFGGRFVVHGASRRRPRGRVAGHDRRHRLPRRRRGEGLVRLTRLPGDPAPAHRPHRGLGDHRRGRRRRLRRDEDGGRAACAGDVTQLVGAVGAGARTVAIAMAIRYEWRGDFTSTEANALHAEAFETRSFSDDEWDWRAIVAAHSLGWVVARDDDGGFVGFVNVVWDGLVHAWIQDVMVAARHVARAWAPSSSAHARDGRGRPGASGCTSTSTTSCATSTSARAGSADERRAHPAVTVLDDGDDRPLRRRGLRAPAGGLRPRLAGSVRRRAVAAQRRRPDGPGVVDPAGRPRAGIGAPPRWSAAINSPRLTGALDQLVGRRRWARRVGIRHVPDPLPVGGRPR